MQERGGSRLKGKGGEEMEEGRVIYDICLVMSLLTAENGSFNLHVYQCC